MMEGKGPGPPVVGGGGNGGAPVVRRLRTLKRRKEEKESSKNQVHTLFRVKCRLMTIKIEKIVRDSKYIHGTIL